MKTAIVEIEGIAPISFSKQHDTPKLEGEHPDTFDKRTWREKVHAHEDGRVYIPGLVLAKALISTAVQVGDKVPGRGSKRWGSVFVSGIMSPDPIDLMQPAPSKVVPSSSVPSGPSQVPVMKEEIAYVDVYCHGDPSKRSGGRVWRRFPIVHKWSGIATILIVNDTITEPVLKRHLEMCGLINGLGRWSPQQSGEYGRFKLLSLEWHDEAKLRAA